MIGIKRNYIRIYIYVYNYNNNNTVRTTTTTTTLLGNWIVTSIIINHQEIGASSALCRAHPQSLTVSGRGFSRGPNNFAQRHIIEG